MSTVILFLSYANVKTIYNCQISEKVKPHPAVINMLTKVEDIIPKWKIVPAKDVINSAFKDPAKRERVSFYYILYIIHTPNLVVHLRESTIMQMFLVVADKEKQVDIPRQAKVKNSIRNVENQHES